MLDNKTLVGALAASLLLLSACSHQAAVDDVADRSSNTSATPRFDISRDLFLPQFDSKTDVDDIHSVAGVATILSDPRFSETRFRAVAGAYGIQEGLYVPAEELFEMAYGDNWSDAHANREQALGEIVDLVASTLAAGGQVWVAEAGQSDFTADWLRRVNVSARSINTKALVHVVQHSEWNESVTSPDKLAYVREHASYHKIDDGNFSGNGTPNFKLRSGDIWEMALENGQTAALWRMARDIGNQFNGKDGRYLNESIEAGGIDFSDTVESCWILGCAGVSDAESFFNSFQLAE